MDELTTAGFTTWGNTAIRSPSIGNPKNDLDRPEKMDQACREFESLFLNYMMKEMRKSVPQDGLFDGGQAEEIFTSMLDTELTKSISQHQSLGLASMLFRQLTDHTVNED